MTSVPSRHAVGVHGPGLERREPGRTAQRDNVVMLSYRGPLQRVGGQWVRSAGGLVTVLEPLASRWQAPWIHAGGDDAPRAPEQGYRQYSVPVAARARDAFYAQFANGALWPVLHGFDELAEVDHAPFNVYEDINRAFAEITLEHLESDDLVWVHDYHLMRTPLLLKHTVPSLRVGWFCHVPWPEPEQFAVLPWRVELLEGVLGADVVGFHCARYVENFLRCVERFVEAEVSFGDWTVRGSRGVTRAIVAPVGLPLARVESLADSEGVREQVSALKRSVGGRRILLGVDRLDYTKGIEERLTAYARLLEQQRDLRDQVVFLQVVVPSRESVPAYARLKSRLERLVAQINQRHGRMGQAPLRYMYGSLEPDELYAHYRAADVAVVTPLCDGMNLVALEYVAAQRDEAGALVLSEFAGAARHLTDAYLVNPHDREEMTRALARAIADPAAERRRRMQSLRAAVASLDVHAWADRFLGRLRSVPQTRS